VTLSFPQVYLGLCVLFVLLVPVGLVLVRLGERWLGRSVRLTWVEQVLLAFYLAGGLLYILGSVPAPLFGGYLVIGVLVVGVLGAAYLRIALRVPFLGRSTRVESDWELIVLAAGTLSLLAFELFPVWQHPLPNSWDGSAVSLWVNLTVSNHTLPWSLQPYTTAGVTYPQGQTIWMALPVVLWGWSDVSVPILVPPLFLALSLPAAYCWGRRLGGVDRRAGQTCGLVFAAFFALVASWPRLYVVGSYDFVMALPLVFLLLGGLRELVTPPSRPWGEVLLLGAGVGVLASLSLSSAEAVIVLLLGFVVILHRTSWRPLLGWFVRLLVVVGIVAAFLVRSLVGTFVWFGYPSHVLAQTGSSQQTPPPLWAPFGSGLLQQELDPFVPWKGRLSPFPAVSLVLQVLLVLAIVLAGWVLLRAPPRLARLFPPRFLTTLLGTSAILFLLTALLVTSQLRGPWFTFLGAVTSFDETSYLLFIGLSALACAPLVAAAQFLSDRGTQGTGEPPAPRIPKPRPVAIPSRHRWATSRSDPRRAAWVNVAVIVGLLAPLTVGAVATALDGPAFLENSVANWSQVTAGDLTVLEWASVHLPSCSAVFVAPGSVGQFLPEYAEVHLVYQMTPSPWDRSYYVAFDNLSSGVYDAGTRLALVGLGVTEVFVSGATTPHYLPIDPGALENVTDFRELTQAGDASLFQFLAGNASASCAPI